MMDHDELAGDRGPSGAGVSTSRPFGSELSPSADAPFLILSIAGTRARLESVVDA